MKKINVILILSLLLVLIAACSSDNTKEELNNNENNSENEESAEKGEDIELRVTWSGTTSRHERTMEVIDLFEDAHPNIKISAEYAGTDQFSDALNTQIAGGNAPDLMNLGGYTDLMLRGALMDLTPYVESGKINLDNFDSVYMDPGIYDNKYYGISLGTNGIGYFFNKSLAEKAGMDLPEENLSWEELADYGKDLIDTMGDEYSVFADQSGYYFYFLYFLRQSEKALVIDGEVGFEQEDVERWFEMWEKFRSDGLIPTPEQTANYTDLTVDTSILPGGKTLFMMSWMNQLTAYQNAMEDELELIALPTGGEGAENGLWVHPSQFWTINENSKHPDESATFIDFFINDPEATMILGSERGIPGSKIARDKIRPDIDETEAKIYDYFEDILSQGGEKSEDLPNSGEFNSAFLNASQRVAFGQQSIEEAAQDVITAAEKAVE